MAILTWIRAIGEWESGGALIEALEETVKPRGDGEQLYRGPAFTDDPF
uniref:Uncharacterized protein n=1 Tax=Candidatus Kentrum eta TaxID=2126337 RepID=A0A450V7S9_9GAMM|nr:MAG: hypothetical protein BECKH772B_GA0070898_102081 [Candidatus Kentron sp. H]VFK00876.1 MAG: hypothetical protein BECKH772A_GA0070896_102051 [Candidatus Kentron sp. H]VFK04763.1 MAG: hypothetical protein BECKH772C_GA0070978_102051 [Candidatus Kentron sp. H]